MSSIIPQKQCSQCKQLLPATTEYFHIRRASKDGLSYICKPCNVEHTRQWRANHPEKYAEYNEQTRQHQSDKKRTWRKSNPDKVRKHKSDSQKRHPESNRRRQKRYYASHPEEKSLIGYKGYWSRVQRSGREWITVANHKRRARLLSAEGSHTKEELVQLFEEQEHRCGYCGITLYQHIPFDRHLDHIQPISRGGSNSIENLVYTCQACNSSKNDRTFEEWKAIRSW